MSIWISLCPASLLPILVAVACANSAPSTSSPSGNSQTPKIVRKPSAEFDIKTFGATITTHLYTGNDAEIWSRFSPKMKLAMKDKRAWTETRESLLAQLGEEIEVLREDIVDNEVNRRYWRLVRFENVPVPLHVMWDFDKDRSISGFSVKPEQKEAESHFLKYRSKIRLQLPFTDQWYVFWGGRNILQNYHTAARDQRFAYDFLVVKDGLTHMGDGSANDDYYCYGKPIVAPGKGVVIEMTDGIAENVPGQKNTKDLLGNFVVIDHENDEYSFFAHFKTNSVLVKEGDVVQPGTPLGQCGNSGHSTEPHLHYHLQNTPVLFNGEGLPLSFHTYIADGKEVEEGEPVQGESIRNARSFAPHQLN